MTRRALIPPASVVLLAVALALCLCTSCDSPNETDTETDTQDRETHADTQDQEIHADTQDQETHDSQSSDLPPEDIAEDTSASELDAVDSSDTEDSDGGPGCDRDGFTIEYQESSGEAGFVEYAAAASTEAPTEVLTIELLHEVPPSLPFLFPFSGENYKTCINCVTIRTQVGCEGTDCEGKLFLVQSGSLEITRWDPPGPEARFTGFLRDIEAIEVTLAGGMDFTSTPVEGGEVWCIGELGFDTALAAWE